MAGPKPLFAPHAAYATDADTDFVVFRLLLPRSFGDDDAIRLYAAIAPLRRRTAALQVRVDALESCPNDATASRVAVVLGPTFPTRRVEGSSSTGRPLELSPVQEALVSLVEVGGVLHRVVGRGPECVTCLVLVEAARLEAAFGMGGLGAIASEAGAEVRVTSWAEDAPPSVQPPEVVVEVTGDRTTIRNAIVSLSSCVQGDLQASSSTISVTTASPMPPSISSGVPETNVRVLQSEVSTEYASSTIHQTDCPQGVKGDVETQDLQQISFRLLCHVNIAGDLIGKKGAIVKGFEDETGASIDVSNPLSGCMEHVITISALESPGTQYSKVQSALLCVFDRMEEINRHLMFDKPSQCSARVLVLTSQFDCLIGLGGAIMKEMVRSTRAGIEILNETYVPACASRYERVLEITGELVNVRDALFLVSGNLRNHASSKRTKYNDINATTSDIVESTASSQVNISSTGHHSTDNFPRIDHGPSLNEMNSVENSFSAFHLGSPGSSQLEKPANVNDVEISNSKHEVQKPASRNGLVIKDSNSGVPKSANGNVDGIHCSNLRIASPEEEKLVRGIKTATVIRTTYEIAACGGTLYLLYGDHGNNLAQLREISGAEITVHDPPRETSGNIVISGRPDQAQLALAGLIDLTQQIS